MFGAGLICGAYMTKVAPALPLQRAELGLTLVQSGFIATLFNAMGGVLGVFVGMFATRMGLRRAALTGLALMAAAGLLGAASPGFALLLASRFIEGIGFMLFTVTGSALIASAALTPRDRDRALGLWSAYMPTGGGLALLAAPAAIAAWGWRGLWSLLALVAGLCFLLTWRRAPRLAAAPVPSGRLLRESLARPGNLAFALLFVFYVSQWVSVMVWLPTFVVDERGVSATTASMLTAFMVLANIPGNLAAGALLARGAPRGPMIILASLGMALCSAGMLGPWLPDGLRYALCLLFSAVAGLIPGAIFSGLPVHAKTPQHISTANGMVMQGAQVGQFIGPIVVAWLASAAGGWGATLWAMVGFAAGAALCGAAVLHFEKGLA